MRRQFRSALFALSLASCATPRQALPTHVFSVADDQAHRRFVLRFQNLGSRTLCLSPALWPDDSATLPMSGPVVPSVSIDGQEFPLHTAYVDFLTGSERVAAGTTAIAYLNYSAFNIPASLDYANKVLNLDPKAVVCTW